MFLKYDYSYDKVKFLKENVKGIYLQELTDKFNKEFNCNLDKKHIECMKRKLNLTSGVDTKFKKGQTPYNKGKKMSQEQYKKIKNTMFKMGNKTYNTKELFSERVDKDGYTYIKVGQPNKWKLKHRWIFESMYGNIPTGYKVIFADGNKQNFNSDNLMLVSNSELFIINQKGLYKNDKNLTKSGVLVAKVLDKVNKIKKENKK